MTLTIPYLAACIVMGIILIRRGRDQGAGSPRSAQLLRIAALLPFAVQIGILLVFGFGEIVGGDWSGAIHLLAAIAIATAGALAWMRPFEGGLVLLACGLLSALGFLVPAFASGSLPEGARLSPALLITAVPVIISGVLFFLSARLARRSVTRH